MLIMGTEEASGGPQPDAGPSIQLGEEEMEIGVAIDGDRVVIPAAVYSSFVERVAQRGRLAADAEVIRRLSAWGYSDLNEYLSAVEAELTQQPPHQENHVSDPAAPASPTPAAGAPAIAAPAQPAAAPAPVQAPTPPAYQPPAAASPPVPGQQPGAPAGAQPGQPDPNDRTLPEHIRRKMQQVQQKAQQQYTTLQQQHAAEVAKAAALQQQVDALNEEMRLKLEMSKLGVTDLDFAWFEMSKHLKTLAADKSPEGQKRLAEFSPQTWAEEQRKTRPFIFGQMPVPAQTGAVGQPGSQPAPTAPSPAQVTGAAAGAGTFDARTSSPRDFEAHMRSLGINYVGSRPVRPQ